MLWLQWAERKPIVAEKLPLLLRFYVKLWEYWVEVADLAALHSGPCQAVNCQVTARDTLSCFHPIYIKLQNPLCTLSRVSSTPCALRHWRPAKLIRSIQPPEMAALSLWRLFYIFFIGYGNIVAFHKTLHSSSSSFALSAAAQVRKKRNFTFSELRNGPYTKVTDTSPTPHDKRSVYTPLYGRYAKRASELFRMINS